MSSDLTNFQGAVDHEDDRQAEAMKDQLRKDVAARSAERDDRPSRQDVAPRAAAPRLRSLRPVAEPKTAISIKPAVGPSNPSKKPFTMSYGNVTPAEHINAMLARRAK
jgi:hypothetical protein